MKHILLRTALLASLAFGQSNRPPEAIPPEPRKTAPEIASPTGEGPVIQVRVLTNLVVLTNRIDRTNVVYREGYVPPGTNRIPPTYPGAYLQSNMQGVIGMEYAKLTLPYKLENLNYGSINESIANDLNSVLLLNQEFVPLEGHLGFLLRSGATVTNAPVAVPAFLFKISLMNPKRPRLTEATATLVRLDQRLWGHGMSLSPVTRQTVQDVQQSIKRYQTEKWIRPSVGIFLPFTFTNAFSNQVANADVGNRIFPMDEIGFFVGWDLFDVITAWAGLDLKGRLTAGLSLDLTTPIYASGAQFVNFVKQLFKVPL